MIVTKATASESVLATTRTGFFQFIGPASRCQNRLKAAFSFRQFFRNFIGPFSA